MAQRLYKRHILVVLNRTDAMQPRAPHLNLLQEPLIGFRLAPVAPDHHLLRQTAAVRSEHGMQTQHRARMRRQHRLQGTVLDRGQIHQNTVFRQRRQLRDYLLRKMDRHADNHHAGIAQQRGRAIPVLFIQRLHAVARQRQHARKQAAHLPFSADDYHRTQRRIKGFKAFIVLAGIGLAHHAAQDIFNQIGRNAERFRLFTARSQH